MNPNDLPNYSDFHHGTGWCRNDNDYSFIYYCIEGDWKLTVIVGEDHRYEYVSENHDSDYADHPTPLEGARTLQEACSLAYTYWRME